MSWIGNNRHIVRSKRLYFLSSIFVFIFTFFIGCYVIDLHESSVFKEKRNFLNNELIARANTLVQSINYRFSFLYGVKAFVTANTELFDSNPQEFEKKANIFLKTLHQHVPNVSSVAISPGGTHKYVYPVTDRALNTIGHNLLTDKRVHVRAKVQETISSRVIGISGPYALRGDGKLGLIARLAIYQDDLFWGLTTMVLDIPPILAEANLQNLNNKSLQFALRIKGGDVFYGSAIDFESNPILYEINLPDGKWELTVKSNEGLNSLNFVIPLFVINFLISFLVSMLLFTFLSRKKYLETEINKAIAKEKQSLDALEAVFQALPDLYFRMSKDGTILDYRAKNKDELYVSPIDFLNFKMQDVLPSNIGSLFVEKVAQYFQTKKLQTFEYSLAMPKGVYIYEARLTSLSDTDELVMVVREITERKKTEESMQLASTVYTNSSEGMAVTDSNNRIIAINPAFTKITGYKEEDVLGKDPGILNSDSNQSDDFDKSMREIINTTGHWHGEISRQRKNGEAYIERLTINTIFNEEGLVHHRVALFSDITEKKKAEELIFRQAYYDPLTQLPNRRMLRDRLDQEIKKSDRAGLSLALLFIDLDRFKEVNDSLGHDMGDLLLIESAKRILACVRDSDTVARFGGDEFTVILSDLAETHSIERIAQNIIKELSKPFSLENNLANVSASIGISLYPDDASDTNELQKIADQAMYLAKDLGRSRFSYFTKAMQQAAQFRTQLLHDMKIALVEGQFQLYYQPIVYLTTKEIYKAEALLRWNHPRDGMISPADFIPLAEESGLIVDIGNWVFKEAARQVKYFKEKLGVDIQISINKSPVQFQATTDHKNWIDFLQELNLSGDSIVIEITEGLLMEDDPNISKQLLQFRDAGIQVSIDDFGTGYSSLSYLKKFDIDFLKIDQSFIKNLAPDSDDMALSEAIIVMAHKLGLQVIAEGIETEQQRQLLLGAGCDYGQGYLFSKPIPGDEFENLF